MSPQGTVRYTRDRRCKFQKAIEAFHKIMNQKSGTELWLFSIACGVMFAAGCMPPQTYRPTVPPPAASPPPSVAKAPAPTAKAPATPEEAAKRQTLQESKIREQDLKRTPTHPPAVKDSSRENQPAPGEAQAPPDVAVPPLRDDSS